MSGSNKASESWIDLEKYDQSWFIRGRKGAYILLWWLLQSIIFPLTLHNADKLRCSLLRLFGAVIGKGVKIRPTARFTYPWKVSIGDHSWIGDDVVFYSLDEITIGSHSVISQKSYLCTGSHDPSDPTFKLIVAPILIENGVWIAADCFIAPGVKIGSNSVIGVRSTVLSSILEGQVAWGSPCLVRYPKQMKSASS